MKYYFVDLRALPISERIAACKKMEQYAWEVFVKVRTSALIRRGLLDIARGL